MLWHYDWLTIMLAAVWLWIALGSIIWIALGFIDWPIGWIAIILGALGVGISTAWLLRRPNEIDPALTIGDMVLAMTSARECREAGYRLNRHEIFLKARAIFVEFAGVQRDQFKPETTMRDLFG